MDSLNEGVGGPNRSNGYDTGDSIPGYPLEVNWVCGRSDLMSVVYLKNDLSGSVSHLRCRSSIEKTDCRIDSPAEEISRVPPMETDGKFWLIVSIGVGACRCAGRAVDGY